MWWMLSVNKSRRGPWKHSSPDRPVTESLVESIVKFVLDRHDGEWAPRIADVGCGSGVIAVSLAHVCRSSVRDVRDAQFFAIDSSPQALSLCKTNAIRHRVADSL